MDSDYRITNMCSCCKEKVFDKESLNRILMKGWDSGQKELEEHLVDKGCKNHPE